MELSVENTAAHHLHTLLTSVRDSGKLNLREAWCKILDAEWGSLEFAKRHSEVVTLLQMTISQLNSLPERARSRCERHVGSWWILVMQPILNWSDTNRNPSVLFDTDQLDHLESTADLISRNLVGSSAAPRNSKFEDIVTQCQDWIEFLASMGSEEIEEPLRNQLISQIRHLIWLIENANLFGGARVAEEASTVIGSLAQTGASLVNVRPDNASRWKTAMLALVTACVVLNQATPIIQDSITAGETIVKEIASVVEEWK
ncbi:hypothetical protein [Streptomyces sp. XY006]|uniref:hypothetical protein n=1 Tax=Streptomyces sp. XY006 TaxID=2021410 RepID=UPI00117F003F|nr:hypothetical protein [Streptomyces sp. XY006]